MNGIIPTPKAIGSREELLTLPVGAYVIPSEKKIESRWFDVRQYLEFKDVPLVVYANIMEQLQRGLGDGMGIDITVRPDGKIILAGWAPEEGYDLTAHSMKLQTAPLVGA